MKAMVAVQLDMQYREEISALVPQEREHVSKLISKGVLESLYMSESRFAFWIVMKGESLEQIQQELGTFPLYPYMKLDFTPLAETGLQQ